MSLFTELRRRNVFRVGIAYVVFAWLLIQVGDVMFEAFEAPEWALRGLVIALAIGLPLFLVGAWALELTPEGIKWESEVDRNQSVTAHTGRKLNNVILVLALIAVAYLLFDKFYLQDLVAPTETAAVATLPADISPQSIAVLPFENRSNLAEDEFFVEGVHDDLLTNLSRIGDLKVISRTTVSQYADTAKTIPEIAGELGVATIMEGAVQRSGQTVRINVQLIDAATDEHLWAEIFDRQLTADNLFDIQTEISQAIAQALASELTPGEADRIADHPTENLEAYQAYLRGRQALTLNSSSGADRAMAEFRKAVELDPDFALGWVGIAFAAAQGMRYSDLNLKEAGDIAEEGVERALALNDQLGEAYLAKSILFGLRINNANPEKELALQRALELIPGSAEAWLNYSDFLADDPLRMDEALAAARKAAELDPLSAEIRNHVVEVLARSGRIEEAEQQLLDLIDLNPEFARNYDTMSGLMTEQGRFAEALHWRRQAQQKDPGNILFTSNEIYLLTTMGLEEEYEGLIERVDILDPNSSTSAFVATMINLRTDNIDGALESVDAYIAALSSANPMIHTFKSVILSFGGRDEAAIAHNKHSFPNLPPAEALASSISAIPERACPIAWLMARGDREEHGLAIARATIDEFNAKQQPGRPGQLRLGIGICQLLLGDNDAALNTVVNAVEHRKLQMWWMELMHPAYDGLAMEPAYQQALEDIDVYMAAQREQHRAIEAEGGP